MAAPFEFGWQQAFVMVRRKHASWGRGSGPQGRRIGALTASWPDHTWDSTSIRIASSVAATS
jgi:hypothetical protein